MAFNINRCNFLESGKTGLYSRLWYNAQGSNGDGGDVKNTVAADGFFTHTTVIDAVLARHRRDNGTNPRTAVGNQLAGSGLPFTADCRDGQFSDVLYWDPAGGGSLKCRSGDWRMGTVP